MGRTGPSSLNDNSSAELGGFFFFFHFLPIADSPYSVAKLQSPPGLVDSPIPAF